VRVAWLALALVLLGAAPASAFELKKGRLGGQFRYWFFEDGNDLRDVLAYWATRSYHVQLEYWDFRDPEAGDQFRPEIGIHLRDRRQSVYTVQWRHEGDKERFWFGTDQILTGHFVGRVLVSPIVSNDLTLWVVSGGADYYWGSWNFASLDVIRDPRLEGLWVVPMRVRLANEANDWIQLTYAPASQSTSGYALDLKKRWVRLGLERNNRYDFTTVDNWIVTVGFEVDLPKPR
jgi:hypothetical protein